MECGGSLGSWNKSAQCGTAQHSTAQRNTAQHSTASHSGTKHERAQQEHSAVRRRTATVNLRASITKHSAAQRSTHLPARGGVDDALRPVLGQQVAEGVPAAQSIVRHPECIKGFQMVCQNDARRAKHPPMFASLPVDALLPLARLPLLLPLLALCALQLPAAQMEQRPALSDAAGLGLCSAPACCRKWRRVQLQRNSQNAST